MHRNKIRSIQFSLFIKTVALSMAAIMAFTSCAKNTPAQATEALPAGTALAMGMFKNDAHAVSGTAKVITDASGKKFLSIENFSSENGPDLHVWLSPNTSGSPYIEAGLLKAAMGQFSYELPPSFDYATNNHVLIWCKRFSALFGHAVLQ